MPLFQCTYTLKPSYFGSASPLHPIKKIAGMQIYTKVQTKCVCRTFHKACERVTGVLKKQDTVWMQEESSIKALRYKVFSAHSIFVCSELD